MKTRTLAYASTALLALGAASFAQDTARRIPLADTVVLQSAIKPYGRAVQSAAKSQMLAAQYPEKSVSQVTFADYLIRIDTRDGYGWEVELKNRKTGRSRVYGFHRGHDVASFNGHQSMDFLLLRRESGGPAILVLPRISYQMGEFLQINFDAGRPEVLLRYLNEVAMGFPVNTPLATIEKDGKLYFFTWSSFFTAPLITVTAYDIESSAISLLGRYERAAGVFRGLCNEARIRSCPGCQSESGSKISMDSTGFTVHDDSGSGTSFEFNQQPHEAGDFFKQQ